MGTDPIFEFRPEDPAFLADPFPVFARMRDQDPCHWSPRLKSWVLTRYDDVKRVCLGSEMSSNRLAPFFATLPSQASGRIASLVRYLSLWMVFRDPPDHTRLRRLASKVFTVKAMRAMRANVESIRGEPRGPSADQAGGNWQVGERNHSPERHTDPGIGPGLERVTSAWLRRVVGFDGHDIEPWPFALPRRQRKAQQHR